ncbi:MAG: DNA polymerase III subunit beta [Clostridia bacterium]|jgi:DNA polymerase-3 subunit beta|nr:DNA polymerase III subunit beta [Clostridia bacterium]
MKLTCNKEELLEGINIVSKAISTRTTMPILECILLSAEDEGLTLTGNDLEIGIKSSVIEADVEKQGKTAIEARLFSEIIKRLNGNEVTIDTSDEKTAKINCGMSEFTIVIQQAEDFPSIPEVEKDFKYEIKQCELKKMITQTIFSVAADESKPVLTGELFEIKSDCAEIVAVDGFRISYRKTNIEKQENTSKVIVPAKTMREISRILSDDENAETEIFITDKHILFSINGNTIVSRLIEGDYIKYEQTFTNEYKTKVTVNNDDLISALERATLISRDAKKMPVKLDISNGKIVITAQTEIGKAYEEVGCISEGDELKIAFNPRFLIEALKACDDEKVCIHFNGSLSPCIIKPEENENYKYLVLPLRM